jgi:hypothetical protein
MRYGALATVLAASMLASQAVAADDKKIDVKVLYAGKPGDARTKDYVAFLRQHFVHVGEADYEKFKPNESKDFDVVIFDWPSIYPRDKDGKIAPKITHMNSPKPPNLPNDFDRPAILIGAAGSSATRQLQLKINWL